MNVAPPDWPLQILRRFCPAQHLEEIEGDLLQRYEQDYFAKGAVRANRRFVKNVLLFLRPEIITRSQMKRLQPLLFRYNLKLVLRNITSHKTLALINLTGLSIALAIGLLTAQYVSFEFSFDQSASGEKIYRVNLSNATGGVFQKIEPSTVSGLAYALNEEATGIKSLGRITSKKVALVFNKARNIEQREDDVVVGDAAVLQLLSLAWQGNPAKTILATPDRMVISESAAKKYFGTLDVIGKPLEISIDGSQLKPYTIDGVFRDIPLNRHQRFNFLLAIDDLQSWNQNWSWSNCFTYLSIDPKSDIENLASVLASIVKTHHHPIDGKGDKYLLEPITDIRLHAIDGTGKAEVVYFIILLAAVILLLAWFNNTNLAVARFFENVRDVGIRKLNGGSRRQIFFRVLVEALVYHIIAFGCAVFIFSSSWPTVCEFIGDTFAADIFLKPETYFFSALFIFTGSFAIGIYPATFLSSIKPVDALRGNVIGLSNKSQVRRSMVTIQLAVTIALVSAVIIIQRQIDFMRDQDLGINIDRTLVIREPLITDNKSIFKYNILRDELLSIPGVAAVTYASSFPGAEIDWHRADITIGGIENVNASRISSRIVGIGTEFMEAFDLTLTVGRNFNPLLESDNKSMVISEKASQMFGFKNYQEALGKQISIGSRNFEVIGVVNNYHYRSFQTEIEPLLYIQGYPRNPSLAVKLSSGEMLDQIAVIESKWKAAYTGNAFSYYFLDDFFDNQYQHEDQLSKLTSILTIIAIVISCSGIFALSLYEVNRRTREIGIRKVLGASAVRIMKLISDEFVRMVLVAAAIGLPLVYVAQDLWLQRFAYRASSTVWILIIPVVIVMLLVLLSVALQILQAARRNPIDCIRHE